MKIYNDPANYTKSGNPRQGKPNITARRLEIRFLAWEPLKQQLRYHIALSPHGEAKRIARACGIAPSQIHRFTCEHCDHDQEPSFSIGIALTLYLAQARLHPVIDIERRKKRKKHAHSNKAKQTT